MNYLDTISITGQRLKIRSFLPQTGIGPAREEIIEGLKASPKNISSKFFYNTRGSQLYEQITALVEYYPNRTEKQILRNVASRIMKSCEGFDIVELGPGDPSKISLLLDATGEKESLHYLPMDISESAIRNLADELVENYPHLLVDAYVLDFTSQFGLIQRKRPALICFFGSTIGNFSRNFALDFVRKIARDMKQGDRLLLGLDLIKDKKILHAAYNDSQGITAAFNLNILSSINDILESNFREWDFRHLAFYNPEESRIEMHLEALRDVRIESPHLNEDILISKGERIHTENSHKFNRTHLKEISEGSGLSIREIHSDDQDWFALVEFEKR